MKALCKMVKERAACDTVLRTTIEGDKQAAAAGETIQGIVRQSFITLKSELEAKTDQKLKKTDGLIPWLVRRPCWCRARYKLRKDGATPYQVINGNPYHGTVCNMAEMVMCKVKTSKHSGKFQSHWRKGAWLGKSEINDACPHDVGAGERRSAGQIRASSARYSPLAEAAGDLRRALGHQAWPQEARGANTAAACGSASSPGAAGRAAHGRGRKGRGQRPQRLRAEHWQPHFHGPQGGRCSPCSQCRREGPRAGKHHASRCTRYTCRTSCACRVV